MKHIKSIEHIAQETCLRQFKRAKDDLSKLAKDANYNGEKLKYLISLLPGTNDEEEIDPIVYESDEEVKKILLYCLFIISRF